MLLLVVVVAIVGDDVSLLCSIMIVLRFSIFTLSAFIIDAVSLCLRMLLLHRSQKL